MVLATLVLLTALMSIQSGTETLYEGEVPKSAYELQENAFIVAALTISVSGQVTGCSIKQSSGDASIDTSTCNLAMKRIRMAPAKDDRGNPVESTYDLKVRWEPPK